MLALTDINRVATILVKASRIRITLSQQVLLSWSIYFTYG